MEEISLFRKTVERLSADEFLINDTRYFVESLEISWASVKPWKEQYELCHTNGADALMEFILSQWISKKGAKATLAELSRILLQMKFRACAEELQNLEKGHSGITGPIKLPNRWRSDSGLPSAQEAHSSRNPPPEIATPIIFGVRIVVLNFIGRDKELKELNVFFHSGVRFVVISGLGGIGKTELTKEFVLTVTLPDNANSIVKSWLSGENLQNSTSEFCQRLNLATTDSDGKPLEMIKMLQDIMTSLRASAGFVKWLVVIDNVDETSEEFKTAVKTLCSFSPDVFLLVTSRRRDIYAGESEHLEVTQLKLEDSMEFVRKSLNIKDNSADEAIKSLCNELGNFPLALSQAVAYIKQQKRLALTGRAYGVQNYLDELSKSETLGLDEDLQLAEYPKATIKVWHITLDKIKECHGVDGAMALDLLDVMAFINPDEIQMKLFCKFFKLFYAIEDIDMNQIDSYLTILLQYSLISSCNSVINIHRLVQLAVRTRMATTTDQNNPHRKDVEILKTFWTSFNFKEYNENEMTHILKIWNHSSNHSALDVIRSSRIKVLFDDLLNLKMISELLEVASEGCGLALKLYGPENKEYLQMVLRLGMALFYKGEYEAAFKKLTFAYDKLKKLCGENNIGTLKAGEWIVDVLRALKKYEELLAWGQKFLKSKIKIYGNNHESTKKTKRDLAATLKDLGRREEEIKMLNEILEAEEDHSGKDHPSTIETRREIALCFCQMGKYPEARDVLQKMLSIEEEHLRVDHPLTLYTKKWLADTLDKMGKIEEALKIYEEVLIAREKFHEPLYSQGELQALRDRVRDLKVKIKDDGATEEHTVTDSQ